MRSREILSSPDVLDRVPVYGADPQDAIEVADRLLLLLEVREQVQFIIENMPIHQRVLLEGVFYEQCSLEEMAERLGVHKATVMRRRNRALQAVGERLEAKCQSMLEMYLGEG